MDFKVHHTDAKGKIVKVTPYRRYTWLGKADLFVHLYRNDNKFTYADMETPYKEEDIPEEIKKLPEFAYLFEKSDDKAKTKEA
jgi:hypothetical protein